jgi:hypothetical protein
MGSINAQLAIELPATPRENSGRSRESGAITGFCRKIPVHPDYQSKKCPHYRRQEEIIAGCLVEMNP